MLHNLCAFSMPPMKSPPFPKQACMASAGTVDLDVWDVWGAIRTVRSMPACKEGIVRL